MHAQVSNIRRIARFAGEVVAETLWPTRCALCDRLGEVLCDSCARNLPFADWWRACPRCGSPLGLAQCDLCNPVSLGRIGRDRLPFAHCASAVMFTQLTGQLVRVYKDQGERRLAGVMAGFMQRAIAPDWDFDAVTFVPATKAAYRHRGFDHCEELAGELANGMGVACVNAFDRPRIHDQRGLTARERIINLNGAFTALPSKTEGKRLLLVDDVFTTGSTLCAATDALLKAGARNVDCLTFARV